MSYEYRNVRMVGCSWTLRDYTCGFGVESLLCEMNKHGYDLVTVDRTDSSEALYIFRKSIIVTPGR